MSESRIGDIKIDEQRYEDIMKGTIRKDLLKYLAGGQVTLPTGGGKTISIVMDQIDIPTWRFGEAEDGIGRGDAEKGDDLGPVSEGDEGQGEQGEGAGPTDGPRGPGTYVVDLTDEEFAEFLQEALELPNIKPKGDRSIMEDKAKYNTVSRTGPQSMMDKRRTLEEAIKRGIAEGTFAPPLHTSFTIEPKDKRYRSFNVIQEPTNNAVIIYGRDVSGSMGPRERRITTYLCQLCEFWLSQNYDRLEKVYIIHDDRAERVNAHDFLHKHTGMGTVCSTALTMTEKIIEEEFPPTNWNIYSLYISDGFNWGNDNDEFVRILNDRLLPILNQFNYAEIGVRRESLSAMRASGGSAFSMPGNLSTFINEHLKDRDNLALATLDPSNLASAMEAMRVFFSKGN